ncbi:MAG TPA: hypothetical protein VIS07_20575 [Candidatus Binatia bacterium]
MDATQRRLVALAREGDMQLRSAAILLLGELRCDEPAAVEAVAAALESGNAVLQDFGLAYAEKVGSDGLLPAIVPFLAEPPSPARERAERILAAAGAAGVSAAAAVLPKLDRRKRGPVAAWIAHQQGKRPRDALLKLLASRDPDAVREAARALVAASAQTDEAGQRAIAERLAERLGDEALLGDEPTLLALVDLAATLARPELRKALLVLVRTASGRARSAAVRALGAALSHGKPTAAEQRVLVELLEDADEWVVRAAADVLAEQPFGADRLPLLTRLAAVASPAARRFALAKMAEIDSGAVVATLLEHLDDADHGGRTAAQTALKHVEGAHGVLVKALLRCDDERRAWVLADILATRREPWKKAQADALLERFDASLARDDRLWSALLHVVRAAGLEERAASMLVERSETLFKKRKFADAARRLALRCELPGADDETRFQLALARLKSGKRDWMGLARRRDEALETLAALERGTFPIAERLRKSRALGLEELFYVAFNLAEEGPTRAAAVELLRHVVAKSPRTKLGKAARNKLTLLERAGALAATAT